MVNFPGEDKGIQYDIDNKQHIEQDTKPFEPFRCFFYIDKQQNQHQHRERENETIPGE
jgi:hypothetical protein